MQIPDIANALFEGSAAFAVLDHCRVILKQKQVRGVSVRSTVFFTSWGVWNVYYYPSLGQYFSCAAGVTVCLMNAFYVYLLLKYKGN